MAGFVREHAGPFVLSLLLHTAVIGLLAIGFVNLRSRPTPKPQLALEATVVDESAVEQEMRQLEEEERRREQVQRQEQERAEELRREREAEEQRLDELKRQRAAEEEAERQRVEQRRQEELERAKAAELETKRKKEQEAKAAAEKKRKAAEEARLKREREAELKRRLAEEERRDAAVDAGLLEQYIALIQARVQRAWIRPPTARAGVNCVVHVTQVPGGEVVSVRVGECNGDEYVRQSIETAVYKASPLPKPPDPALFERNLRLEFKPDE